MAGIIVKPNDFLSFIVVVWIYITACHHCFTAADTTITATAPINPIQEGGMLAFHCRIYNLLQNHDVAITQKHGSGSLRISYSEKILVDTDKRYFLAVRQLSDGSVVYFLSITDVTRAETGEYSCKVLDTVGTVAEVGNDKVDIQVSYMPTDNYPLCAYSEPLTIQAGTVVQYNCSSELGSPNITVHWSHTGPGFVPNARDYYSDNFVTSVLTLRPSLIDTGTMYICTIKSSVFTDIKTCHIGPITVTGNSNDLTRHSQTIPRLARSTEAPIFRNGNDNDKTISSNCNEQCEEQESSLFFWMISTVVAACVAFVLLILGIMLCIKIRYRTVEPPQQYVREDIYAELDKRFDEDAVYMALDRSEGEKVYNAYNHTLPRRSENAGYGNVPTGNTSL
ncbi:uncharacterized protein [Amphiura filiformis]|uniref:uncharacterized protein n=1 Tax=Amphiura filiformis TaxID=82378 RepID=UPI003B215EC8